MKISKELMKGSTAALVLSVLKNQDHALEEEGCLESYWQESDNRKRKYYRLTRKGERRLREKKEEWQTYSKSVERVLSFAN